jgi:iron complex outermembrane receptor protein
LELNFNTFQNYERTSKVLNECNQLQMVIGTTFGTKQNLEQIIGEQLSVQGNFKTGQIKHQLFTRCRYGKFFYKHTLEKPLKNT